MEPKNYVCIFPGLMNYHLIKDVGLLPYTMGKYFNYNASILTYNNDEYKYLQSELKDGYLNLIFLEKKHKTEARDVIYFLFQNSRNIDVLQSFNLHNTSGLFIYFLIYKLLNRKGKTYVKMDANDLIISLLANKKGIWKLMQNFMVKYLIDCISVESYKSYNKLIDNNILTSDKLIYVPNGIYIGYKPEIAEKNDYILTVGDLCAWPKGTDILLEAFSKIKKLNNWKLILIGNIDKSFKSYINEYFLKYPHLKDKIIFKGYISNRNKIYEYYAQSKIFCFPSRSESFGIVLIEAAYFGNYLLTTDVGGAKDILDVINNGEFIKEDDSNYLSERLQDIILNPEKYERDPNELMSIVNDKFNWVKLCKRIYNKLNL